MAIRLRRIFWFAPAGMAGLLVLLASAPSKPSPPPSISSTAIGSLVISPDSKRLLTGNFDWQVTARHARAAAVWDLDSGKLVHDLVGPQWGVSAVAWSPDGKVLATSGGEESPDNPAHWDTDIRLWDAASGKEIRKLTGHATAPGGLAFSPDNKELLSWATGESARLWDVATGKQLLLFPDGGPYDAAWNHAGTAIALAYNGRAMVFDDTGKEICRLGKPGNNRFKAAEFSADDTRLVTASWDKTSSAWNAKTGELLFTFTGHTSFLNGAHFTSDGRAVLSFSDDKTARLWDAQTGREIRSFMNPGRVIEAQLSADDSRLVTIWWPEQPPKDSLTRGISLWDTHTGKELWRMSSDDGQIPPAFARFTPDGKSLFVCLDKPELLDASTGKVLHGY